MPVTKELQDLLTQYLDNVTGTEEEKEEKRKALLALEATNSEDLVKQASSFVEDENNNCPDGWVRCANGACAPTTDDCSSQEPA
jgi:hypothetical protein